MELDQLKNIWEKEEVTETPIISTEKQKEIHLPLEKIRKNMLMEFWMNLISMLILLPLMSVFTENQYIRWTLYFIFLFIVGYYTFKFNKLYQKLSIPQLDTYHSLMELKYDLKLNVELYKSYYVASVPFFMGIFFLLLEKRNFFTDENLIMHYAPFILFFSTTALILGIGSWWSENYYGKYIKQINKMVSDLNQNLVDL
ncbi:MULTISPECIES: hypothetical protein [unclassified Kaistella]|uniref:hypothetical protein n=1 Tax=unclassified Kaistella TaxID=2762626 RepID=UPI0027322C5B|nr:MULTISPECIES: hypothetical protein [unclassified Kaistella]MDP2454566.1 hypothetical protein [Kaistella sp. SH11-4b]MDP2457304.1 hypothetical protein [Kaistella sp. SH40-3]MDP2460064.1 hypothetical protein [Kaistella sp. SH19-2b]